MGSFYKKTIYKAYISCRILLNRQQISFTKHYVFILNKKKTLQRFQLLKTVLNNTFCLQNKTKSKARTLSKVSFKLNVTRVSLPWTKEPSSIVEFILGKVQFWSHFTKKHFVGCFVHVCIWLFEGPSHGPISLTLTAF